jgi:hypothetical protein
MSLDYHLSDHKCFCSILSSLESFRCAMEFSKIIIFLLALATIRAQLIDVSWILKNFRSSTTQSPIALNKQLSPVVFSKNEIIFQIILINFLIFFSSRRWRRSDRRETQQTFDSSHFLHKNYQRLVQFVAELGAPCSSYHRLLDWCEKSLNYFHNFEF